MVSDFNKKGNRQFFNSQLAFKVGGVFVILFVIFMVFEDFKIYKRKQELTAQIALYQKQIQDMKNSSHKLKEEIANANSTDYLEKLGYEQFGETKPGETEYMFVKTPKKVETVAPKSNSWFGWLGQSWNWLKSKF